ncbi:DNA-binding protein RFX2 isoform X2 [Chrysoperla carnea]|nr:DNA-binding protein RFX2 isoform X2 [Chrysoperla carnea]
MTTTARFTPVAVPNENGSSTTTVATASTSSTVVVENTSPPDVTHSPTQQQQPALIVLPASLHQSATTSTVVNGVTVPVIDVSGGLDGTGDSSNESSASQTGQHHSEVEITSVAAGTVVPQEQPSPHFITVTVSADGETVASHQGYHVQYVEPELYAATQANGTAQGQMAYPVYTVNESGTLYAGQGQYYTTGAPNGGAVGYSAPAHYLVQSTTDDILARTSPQTTAADASYGTGAGTHVAVTSTQSGGGQNATDVATGLGHATRVSPATVQWLLENYETAEGVSLPRSTLYAHYLRHCSDHKLEPVNAASFGKLIRSVFLGLRTRRLGTRGNSKYHYYGIRVKPSSSLVSMMDDTTNNSVGNNMNSVGQVGGNQHNSGKTVTRFKRDDSFNASEQTHHHEFLGEGNGSIPDFPDIPVIANLPGECSMEDVDTLRSIYREHCEAFLDAILSLEFTTVESLWREFWRAQDNNNGDECEEEKYLSKSKLYALCTLEPIQEFMRQVDIQFYQNLVQVLLPDVLRPIPSSLTQAIRNFAKGLESWLNSAMTGCPPNMLSVKLSAVSAFSQSLRRYTSLNHLAQAARAVLHNGQQIAQMLADLNRVDFHNVQEQASWVCQCDYATVQRLEADFKLTLQQQNSLEQWAGWLKNVVQTILKPYEGKPNFSTAARQFLLKWSFYSSMVIRDLTLRSAASFGSFHLIRLLYDEYMFYLIEHQVAQATGISPIAVMAESNKQEHLDITNGIGLFDSDLSSCNGGMPVIMSTMSSPGVIKQSPSSGSDTSSSKRHKVS